MSRGLRTALLVVVALVVVALLFLVVFPWFDRTFVNDPTLGAAAMSAVR